MYIYIPNKRLPPFFSKSNQVLTFSLSRLLSKALLSRSPPNLWFTFRGGAPGTLHSPLPPLLSSIGWSMSSLSVETQGTLNYYGHSFFLLGVGPGMVEYLLLGAGTYMTYIKHEIVSDTLLHDIHMSLRCPMHCFLGKPIKPNLPDILLPNSESLWRFRSQLIWSIVLIDI